MMMNSMCAVSLWTGFDESSPTFGMAYYGDMSCVESTSGL